MKQIDKVLLLSELLGIDVSYFVDQKNYNKIEESNLHKLELLIKENEENLSPKYLLAKNKFDELKKYKISSMNDYFKYNLEINYLINVLKNKKFINPLMCSKNEQESSLSQLIITFDGKDMLLGDSILLETYSDQYKIDMVKNLIISWRREVNDSFVTPLQLLLTNPKHLPKKRYFPFNKLFVFMFLLITNSFLFVLFTHKNVYLNEIFHHNYSRFYLSIPLLILLGLIFIFNFFFIFFIIKRHNQHEKYFYAQNKVLKKSKNILKKLDFNTERLYSKILNCITNKDEIKGEVKSFSLKEEYILALEYLKEENINPDLIEDHFSSYEIVLIELIVMLSIYLIVVFTMLKFGVIS